MVKSACGIEAVYMLFNGTGIWGGETIKTPKNLTQKIIRKVFSTVFYPTGHSE